MSKREEAWSRYCYDMGKSGLEANENDGRTAFMAGWSCEKSEPSETETQIAKLADQVTKLVGCINQLALAARKDSTNV